MNQYVLFGLLGGLVWVILYETAKHFASRYVNWKGQQAHLRYIRITFPDAKIIESISVASSDKQAIENIERKLRNASRSL